MFMGLATYLSITIVRDMICYLFFSTSFSENFNFLFIISLYPMWLWVYTVWREFRFPVLRISEEGLTAVIIALIPHRVGVSWENILGIKEIKILEGTLFDYGLSITITPSDKRQRQIFKIAGDNSIFVSSRMQKYDEIVSLISEKLNLPVE